MTGIHDLWLFIVSGLLLNMTPGVDTLYIVGRGTTQGWRAGAVAALGIGAGCIVHTLAAAAGLSAILATSATAFMLIKWVGAAYLVYLGVTLLLSRSRAGARVAPPRATLSRVFAQGFLTNVLNPKVALFFLAFLPQFIAADEGHPLLRMLQLSGAFMAMTFAVFVLYGLFAASVRDRIVTRPAAMTWLRRGFAGAFAALGARLALAER
jgi:threonine/homoserine/homoserine lactone efflux protein